MHNKRALDRRLCRAVARLLVTMAWPPLGPSTRNTWQTRKQCARAALRRDFAHLGCAHANKLSLPLSLFVLFISPSFFLSADFLSSFLFASFHAPSHATNHCHLRAHRRKILFLLAITQQPRVNHRFDDDRHQRDAMIQTGIFVGRIYSRTSFIRTGWQTRQLRR